MGHEDAVYAPALGVALAALKDYKVKTVIALSYGLRLPCTSSAEFLFP